MDDGCATQKHCGANVKIRTNIYTDSTSVCVWSVGTVSLKLFIRGSTLATLSPFLFFVWIQRVLTIQWWFPIRTVDNISFFFFFLFLFNSTSFETCELASLLSHRLLKEEKEFCWSFILNFPESEYIFYFYIRFGYNKKLEMRKYKERDNKNCCRSLYIPGNFVNNKYTVDIVEIWTLFRFLLSFLSQFHLSVDARKIIDKSYITAHSCIIFFLWLIARKVVYHKRWAQSIYSYTSVVLSLLTWSS